MTEDGPTQDFWEFNREGRAKVYVYCDDTRDLYNGDDYWLEKVVERGQRT